MVTNLLVLRTVKWLVESMEKEKCLVQDKFCLFYTIFLKKDLLKNKKINAIVTTGPTKEYIDPVRFISNESSGKQGYEIALELSRLGIKTTLISGPTKLSYSNDIKIKKVISGEEMLSEVKKKLPIHIAVCAAAVSDFKPSSISKNKIKKTSKLNEIKIEKNPDILGFLGKNNRHKPKLLVGFQQKQRI